MSLFSYKKSPKILELFCQNRLVTFYRRKSMVIHTRTFYPKTSLKGGSYETTGGIVAVVLVLMIASLAI